MLNVFNERNKDFFKNWFVDKLINWEIWYRFKKAWSWSWNSFSFKIDNEFDNKLNWFKLIKCYVIDDFYYENFYQIFKFVIEFDEVFNLINKFDDTLLYWNNDVVDLQCFY